MQADLATPLSDSSLGPKISLMAVQELNVGVRGGDIIVTLPGTKFLVTYYKLLTAKSDWEDDPDAPVTLGEFRARAWRAAHDKAREQGLASRRP